MTDQELAFQISQIVGAADKNKVHSNDISHTLCVKRIVDRSYIKVQATTTSGKGLATLRRSLERLVSVAMADGMSAETIEEAFMNQVNFMLGQALGDLM